MNLLTRVWPGEGSGAVFFNFEKIKREEEFSRKDIDDKIKYLQQFILQITAC